MTDGGGDGRRVAGLAVWPYGRMAVVRIDCYVAEEQKRKE